MQQNPPGVTTRDVARVAGVSVGTVNRVLNNLPNVDEGLRDRVARAINELGYVYVPKKRVTDLGDKRSLFSRPLLFCGGSTRESTLNAQNSQNTYYYEVLRGAEYECAIRGTRLLFVQLRHDGSELDTITECINRYDASGIILINCNVHSPLRNVTQLGIPIVNIDAREPEEWPVDIVVSDDLGGAKMLTRHLIGLGHRDIAFINSTPQYVTQVRFDGYRAVLNDAGVPYRSELVSRIPALSIEHAQEAVKRLLEQQRFTAVFCASDNAAFGAIRALYAAGLYVPHDVSVVGFDDHEAAALFTPSLTTIHAGTFEKGRSAVARLLDRIVYPDKPVEWSVIPVKLMVRDSTASVSS